jgi:hypothetical protein
VNDGKDSQQDGWLSDQRRPRKSVALLLGCKARAIFLDSTYRVVEAFGALFAAAPVFGIAATGTMRCAYGVPFHITHGPPVLGSVGKASN